MRPHAQHERALYVQMPLVYACTPMVRALVPTIMKTHKRFYSRLQDVLNDFITTWFDSRVSVKDVHPERSSRVTCRPHWGENYTFVPQNMISKIKFSPSSDTLGYFCTQIKVISEFLIPQQKGPRSSLTAPLFLLFSFLRDRLSPSVRV